MKSGYPPKSLAIVPELPLESLGLKRGEQLIVTQKAGTSAPRVGPPSTPVQPQAQVQQLRETPVPTPGDSGRANVPSGGPDSVTTDAGILVHRVSVVLRNARFIVKKFAQIVPDDNSCLFSSVALVFEQDLKKAPKIREGG